MIPVRCFTCGKVLGHLYYIKEFNEDEFKTHSIKRYCCKKILMTYVDIYDNESVYSTYDNKEVKIKQNLEEIKVLIPN